MATLVIWLSGLASVLSAMGLTVAEAAHLKRPAGLVLTLLVSLAIGASAGLVLFFSLLSARTSWAMPFTAVAVLGSAWLVVWGRGRTGPGLPARATGWSRGRLALLLALTFGLLLNATRNAQLSALQTLEAKRNELEALEQIWWPGVPPALNAAPLYGLAYRKLVPLSEVPGAHEAFEQLWKGGQVQAGAPPLAEWVSRNRGALALAAEAVKRPGYASVEDALWRTSPYGPGRESKIFRLEMNRPGHDPQTIGNQLSLRRVSDLLKLRALQQAESGRFDAAVEDANAVLAMAEQTDSPWLSPESLIARLVAVRSATAKGLGQLRFPQGEGLDAHLQRALIRAEHADLSLATAHAGMNGLTRATFRPKDNLDALFLGFNEVFGAELWGQRVERFYDVLWEAIEGPLAQRMARLRAAQDQFGSTDALYWAPQLPGILDASLRDQARRDCAEVGVAVARYRLDHGQFPGKLDELVPAYRTELPVDPFDGAPLRYLATPEEARIYSVGPLLRDDGGKDAPPDQPGNVAFVVPHPR